MSNRPFRNALMARGYNLLELLLVVIIISVLASIALPNYTKAKEHALGREAIANLKIIAAAERIVKLETTSYQACATTSACNNALSLDLSSNNWAYSVGIIGGGADFHANAARQGSGGYYDCLYGVYSATDPAVESAAGTCP